MSEEDATSQDDRASRETGSQTSTDDPHDGSESAEGTPDEDPNERSNGEEFDEDLLEYVETADSESLAREVASLRKRADSAEAECAELEERVRRIQADFQNYKKRTERRREEEAARATQDLVERLLPVRENLDRAVNQDSETDIRDGVEATLVELDTVLENEGVTPIDPSPGNDVDPKRHEVVHREDDDADSIATVYRRGYEMAGTVIRPAQVTVGTVADSERDDTDDGEPEQDHS